MDLKEEKIVTDSAIKNIRNISKCAHWLIKKIVVTSKSTALTEVNNSYTFHVHDKATKCEIKRVLSEMGLDVLSVRILKKPKKIKSRGGRERVCRKNEKHAIITFTEKEVKELDLYSTS